jgi:hypothetical protein
MARAPKKDVTKAEPKPAAEAVKPKAAARKAAPAKAEKPAASAEKATAAPKKAAAKPAATAAAKAPAKPKGGARARKTTPAVTPEQRYRMIQDAAYFIAEKHGFTGDNHAFWVQAEQEIDAKLAG